MDDISPSRPVLPPPQPSRPLNHRQQVSTYRKLSPENSPPAGHSTVEEEESEEECPNMHLRWLCLCLMVVMVSKDMVQ